MNEIHANRISAQRTIHHWRLHTPSFDERVWCGGDYGAGEENCNVYYTVFHLHLAAFDGAASTLVDEIRRNPDKIDERCYFGASALHYACAANEPDCVRLLLQHGADANATWVLSGSLMSRVIDSEVWAPCDRWTTPFAIAVSEGSTACVRALLEHAAQQDADAVRAQNRRAIDEAVPFFVAATSLRSRATHFLPDDILRTVWAFLKPSKPQYSHVRDMMLSRVCDRLSMDQPLADSPTYRKASEVARDFPDTDGIDAVLAEFNKTATP